MSNVILQVPEISCGHCEKTVTNALRGQAGINSVRVDVPAKKVYLDYDPNTIDLGQVGALLDDEGYSVAGVTETAAQKEKPRFSLFGR